MCLIMVLNKKHLTNENISMIRPGIILSKSGLYFALKRLEDAEQA
jgi:hypothetical protein